jgi:hypothetical protein
LTSPFYNIFSQQWLGLLAPTEWQSLVKKNMAIDSDGLDFIEQMAGGHPFFTQIAASSLWDAQAQDKVDYAQLRQNLWFEFLPHLQYLWRKLNVDQQAILLQMAKSDTNGLDPMHIAALERRGVVRQGRPFSRLFAEMIVGGHLG